MKRQILNEVLSQKKFQSIHLFAIISWGSTATFWLSKVLNQHPEIFCVHELALKLEQSKLFSSDDFWDKFDPIDFMKTIFRLGEHYTVSGDIHSIGLQYVPSLKEYFGKKFHSVVLGREPISRLKSTMSMYNSQKNYKLYDTEYIEKIISTKKIHLPKYDYEHILFVHGVNLLNSIIQEVDYNAGKIFRMEDLVSDTKYLKSLIEEISGGELSTNDELLNRMIKTPPVDQRASKEKIEFEDWQIDVIKTTVDEKAWKLYSELGYSKPNFL